jgi:predicted DNA-binding transcriptional regulator YafY
MRRAPRKDGPGRKREQPYAQAVRVLELYKALCEGGSIRPVEVETGYRVGRRTVQRDLAVLKEVEPCLNNVSGPTDPAVWELPRARRPGGVRREQLLALAIGAEQISFLSGPSFITDVRPLLDQLAAGLGRTERERLARLERKVIVLEPARRRYREDAELQERLGRVLEGLVRELPLHVSYLSPARRDAGGAPRALTVHPLCLALHRQGVYVVVDVVGGDRERLPDRILLTIDRIMQVELVDPAQPFRPPPDFNPREWFKPAFGVVRGRASATVILRVDREWATYVRERSWHASERLLPSDDGGLQLQLDVGDWNEVVDYVLAMGEHVEVLAPPAMRTEVARRLRAAASRYGPPP